METIIVGILSSAVTSGAAIAIAAVGETMAQRTGVINLGIEGTMAMGGVMAIIAVNGGHMTAWEGLLVAALVGLLIGAVFATTTVLLKANQLLAGLALTFLGTGLARHVGRPFSQQPIADTLEPFKLPLLGEIPVVGNALFNHNVVVYTGLFLLPLLAYFVLFRTRHGLAIRAVGQDPASADTSGVSVNGLRFLFVCLASLLAGVSGGYMTLALTKAWSDGAVVGRGWIALTLVFFAGWNPLFVVLGALFFGAAASLTYIVQVQGWGISSYLLGVFPPVATILLLVLSYWFRFRGQSARPQVGPRALTQPFYRE